RPTCSRPWSRTASTPPRPSAQSRVRPSAPRLASIDHLTWGTSTASRRTLLPSRVGGPFTKGVRQPRPGKVVVPAPTGGAGRGEWGHVLRCRDTGAAGAQLGKATGTQDD